MLNYSLVLIGADWREASSSALVMVLPMFFRSMSHLLQKSRKLKLRLLQLRQTQSPTLSVKTRLDAYYCAYYWEIEVYGWKLALLWQIVLRLGQLFSVFTLLLYLVTISVLALIWLAWWDWDSMGADCCLVRECLLSSRGWLTASILVSLNASSIDFNF